VDNVNAEYSAAVWDCDDLDVRKETLHWSNFVKCGWRAALELLSATAPRGVKLLVSGEVPQGAGLSSSSALVCASCLAVVAALSLAGDAVKISRYAMADACMRAERLVGTMGGGMDQAISFLGQAGHGMRIDFDPLRATPCSLPDKACFVVANSLVESHKYISAGSCYNMRVVECRIAARVVAKALGIPSWQQVNTLRQLQELSNKTKEQLLASALQVLGQSSYTMDDVMRLMECSSVAEMLERGHLRAEVAEQSVFRLRQRARHVLSEAMRVDEFFAEKELARLGQLMDASHASCRDDFECSCPELDHLRALAKSFGAYGARLTGAGWGGCMVALVNQRDVATFTAQLRGACYGDDPRGTDACFVSAPGQGAFLFSPPLL
jgi:N-acetylgalactosamine kinase